MHEDPTRRMPSGGGYGGQPPAGGGGYGQPPEGGGYGAPPPGEPGMSGSMKALLILLAALIIGLGVALVIVSSDGGNDETNLELLDDDRADDLDDDGDHDHHDPDHDDVFNDHDDDVDLDGDRAGRQWRRHPARRVASEIRCLTTASSAGSSPATCRRRSSTPTSTRSPSWTSTRPPGATPSSSRASTLPT